MPQVAPLIGLHGPARCGKDTIASFLLAGGVSRYKFAFADALRRMLNAGFGIDLNQPYWDVHKEEDIPGINASPRKLMQTLGTEWGRQMINPDLWLVPAKQALIRNGGGMVVSDVRMENEAAWIREHGGFIIHIERPGLDTSVTRPHSSEAGVKFVEGVDKRFINNGLLSDLQVQVLSLFE